MFSNLAKQMNNLIHYVLAERYIDLLRESSSTLALVRSLRWFNFWYEYYPEYPRKILFLPEYNKIISYESYVFIWLYLWRVNGVLYFSFFSVIGVLHFSHLYSAFFWSLLLLVVDSLLSECSDILPPIYFLEKYEEI